jgi:hypothetical protein
MSAAAGFKSSHEGEERKWEKNLENSSQVIHHCFVNKSTTQTLIEQYVTNAKGIHPVAFRSKFLASSISQSRWSLEGTQG